jgi:hypothetical protein
MADLHTGRVSSGPPFSSVGVDTFGHWDISARPVVSKAKQLAAMFTCLVSLVIHIKVVEEIFVCLIVYSRTSNF